MHRTRNLSSLRETLLPKLLGGGLRVSNLENELSNEKSK